MEVFLSWLLFFVALVSYFGSFQAFLSTEILKRHQFDLGAKEGLWTLPNHFSSLIRFPVLNYLYFIVSPLARHLFGAWTLLSSTIRLLCSYYIHEKGIYLATMFTFIVAFLLYGYQHFVAKTISFRNALSPFLFASISFTLMTFHLLTKN